MDTQTNGTELATGPVVAYCACCTPRQLLIPRDDLEGPGRWAVCPARGAWYANRGDGTFLRAAAPGAWPASQWSGGAALPAIVPGVRIDLSKESYA
jgi:hypothetical protein